MDAASDSSVLDFLEYKLAKEAFVSNLTGSSPLEVSLVLALLPANLCLFYAAQRFLWLRDGSLSAFVVDFLCVVAPCLLCITLLADHIAEYLVVGAAAAVLARSCPGRRSDAVASANVRTAMLADLASSRKRFVSAFKAGAMLLTCLCILAVDFDVFPRRFAKTENFGTSLMDIGVGSSVFAMGLTCPLSRPLSPPPTPASLVEQSGQKQGGSKSRSSSSRSSSSSFGRTVAVVLAVGTGRMVVTKGIEYQEHVTEYGVHWNFFFTLAALMVFGQAAETLRSSRSLPPVCFGSQGLLLAGAVVAGVYQVSWKHCGCSSMWRRVVRACACVCVRVRAWGSVFLATERVVWASVVFARVCLSWVRGAPQFLPF